MSGASVGGGYSGVKVFQATQSRERERLGDRVTEWTNAHPDLRVVASTVLQSSDNAFHCLSITVFYANANTEG
jgi:hypothetical protein